MYVLFSPIGNSDPWRDLRDGAMLHIVRHYQPKKVILFFTKSIFEGNNINKGHKLYDWEKIIQNVCSDCKVEKVISNITNPNDYDIFKDEFHEIINKLHQENPKDIVLLNVTSGTPQMGATLCLEYIAYPEQKSVLQVSTPTKKSNAGVEYDKPENINESLQIVNELEQNEEARYSEIQILSFREAMWKSMIHELLQYYDYVGAKEIFKKLKKDKIVQLLSEKIDEINNQRIFSDIDKRYETHNLKKALCHFLVLQMRFEQNNYSDVLIRIKSLAEFLSQEYLISQNIIKRSSFQYFEFESIKYYSNLKKDKNGKIPKTLNSYILIIETNNLDSSFLKYLNDIYLINDYRNKVAHNLEELDITLPLIEKAFNAIKSLLLIEYPTIKERDLYYFKNFNEKVEKYL